MEKWQQRKVRELLRCPRNEFRCTAVVKFDGKDLQEPLLFVERIRELLNKELDKCRAEVARVLEAKTPAELAVVKDP